MGKWYGGQYAQRLLPADRLSVSHLCHSASPKLFWPQESGWPHCHNWVTASHIPTHSWWPSVLSHLSFHLTLKRCGVEKRDIIWFCPLGSWAHFTSPFDTLLWKFCSPLPTMTDTQWKHGRFSQTGYLASGRPLFPNLPVHHGIGMSENALVVSQSTLSSFLRTSCLSSL